MQARLVRDATPDLALPLVAESAEIIAVQKVEPEHVPQPIAKPAKNEMPKQPVSQPTVEQDANTSTPRGTTEPAPRQSSKALIAASIAATVAVAGGGLFWWYSGKQPTPPVDQATQVQASQPASPTETTVATQPSEPARPIQPQEPPAQPEPSAPVAATLPPAPAPAPAPEPPPLATTAPAVPTPAPSAKPAKPVVQVDPMDAKIDELLRKAKGHVAKGQYDKAIATGESVLAIDAGNRAAKTLISNAKSKQMEALRSNTSLE
ncbi:hypothetical protein [Cupriavidus basilensis]|uniref:hypothetical protein n=1 Tax=Cupriavidus basilensis TaxID=68895 RepID=UPI0039F72C60